MRYLVFIFLILGFIGCDDDPDETIVLPTNLTLILTESTENQGLVTAEASADNVNYFTFIFNEGENSTIIESDGNTESYQFETEGIFDIEIRAHASFEKYASLTKSITIKFEDSVNGIDDSGYSTPRSYSGYSLIWEEEFDGTVLSSDWNYEIGTGGSGWGNNELQYYLEDNTEVKEGYLIITAKKEMYNTNQYTSSRITTQGNKSFQYGRIDIRAKMPFGQGLWPALWMLGNNYSTDGWPSCGEIDIMEMVGGSLDNTTHGTIHWDDNGVHASYGENKKINSGKLYDAFHVYTIVWNSSEIKWYFDDNLYVTADIKPSELSEFHNKFFFIINLAVGGDWPGNPNENTDFPQELLVDYIRVFQ